MSILSGPRAAQLSAAFCAAALLLAGTPLHADNRTADVLVENNTEFDIVVSFGAGELVVRQLSVPPMGRRGIRDAVHIGRNPITVTALTPEDAQLHAKGLPLSRRNLGQFRTALNVNNPGKGRELPRQRLIVVDKNFAPHGILARPAPPVAKLTLDGRWECPTGAILKVEGKKGTLEKAAGHAAFGCKDGDEIWREMTEVKPGVYEGEGLFRNFSGSLMEWRKITIVLKGPDKAEEVGISAVLKRLPDPSPPVR